MIHCLLIFASLSILIIVPLESLLFVVFKPSQFDASKIFKIPALVLELFRLFSFLVMIGLFNVMITEIGKFSIGRLRPHFLTLCKPNLDNGTCRDDLGYEKYIVISNGKCTRKDDFHNYEKHLNDGRKSFLSGHSSFSFYVAVFLVCYLHCRLTHLHISASTTNWTPYWWLLKGIQIFKPYMQFGLLALATYVGMSRISDYMHHPGDVVTGALLGTISGNSFIFFREINGSLKKNNSKFELPLPVNLQKFPIIVIVFYFSNQYYFRKKNSFEQDIILQLNTREFKKNNHFYCRHFQCVLYPQFTY